jgi:hypothetical protein
VKHLHSIEQVELLVIVSVAYSGGAPDYTWFFSDYNEMVEYCLGRGLYSFSLCVCVCVCVWGGAATLWLRRYVVSREIPGSRPDKVNKFFSIYLIRTMPCGLASNRNEYQKQKSNVSGE